MIFMKIIILKNKFLPNKKNVILKVYSTNQKIYRKSYLNLLPDSVTIQKIKLLENISWFDGRACILHVTTVYTFVNSISTIVLLNQVFILSNFQCFIWWTPCFQTISLQNFGHLSLIFDFSMYLFN